MQSKKLILIFLFISNSTCEKVVKVEIASRAIAQILNELNEVYLTRFSIVIIGQEPSLDQIANGIIKRSSTPLEIKKHLNISEIYIIRFNEPQIILCDYNYRKEYSVIKNKNDTFTRYLAYKNSFIIEYFHNFSLSKNYSETIQNDSYHRKYLILQEIHENDSLLMFNNVLFHSNSCVSIFKCVNTFSSATMTWELGTTNYVQKFHNFHKCNIHVWFIKTTNPDFANHLIKFKHNKNYLNNRILVDGYHGEIANIFAEKFDITYRREIATENKELFFEIVIVDISDYLNFNYIVSHLTTPLSCYEFTFVVTRGAKYSQFEKLTLPFDFITWVLISILFVVGFVTIFVFYRLSMELQEIVFGNRSFNPSLNLIMIFFGFGLIHVPSRNFARFLFLMFVLYCLIIRTAYQGKMYEFMTADVRKPTATTVQEMFDMKIPIIVTSKLQASTFGM